MNQVMLKDEFIHFTLSIIAGVIVGYFFNNWWAVPVALISGFFIDSDHLIDYHLYSRAKFNLAEFKSGEYFNKSGKVYVFAHGYEFAIILTIFGFALPGLSWFFFSLALSNFLHLFYDTISNKPIWLTYFLTFRIAKNFNHKSFEFKRKWETRLNQKT